MQPSPSGVETGTHSSPASQIPLQVGKVPIAQGRPWNMQVHPSDRLTAHISLGPQTPSHAGKVALPHGVVPATHVQVPATSAQIGVAGGQAPQQMGGGALPGPPHGGAVVLVALVEVVVVTVVVVDRSSFSAGRQSSTGVTTSSRAGPIWLLVDTVTGASCAPAGSRTR
jgi:hypothetical protein